MYRSDNNFIIFTLENNKAMPIISGNTKNLIFEKNVFPPFSVWLAVVHSNNFLWDTYFLHNARTNASKEVTASSGSKRIEKNPWEIISVVWEITPE